MACLQSGKIYCEGPFAPQRLTSLSLDVYENYCKDASTNNQNWALKDSRKTMEINIKIIMFFYFFKKANEYSWGTHRSDVKFVPLFVLYPHTHTTILTITTDILEILSTVK